jgi:S-disulfanyl-L-cysteine oxidoreductase SoxD
MCMRNFLQMKNIIFKTNALFLKPRYSEKSRVCSNLFPRPLPWQGRVREELHHSDDTNKRLITPNHKRAHLLIGQRIFFLLLSATQLTFAAENPNAPDLGQPASEAEIKSMDVSIYPDGRGLPTGRGNALQGKPLFEKHCVACHGAKGIGASATELANGTHPLTSDTPDKTIGTYWPYATTLFDFIRRAMPMTAPGSLSNNETYALTAYLLQLNNVINEKQEMSAQTLPKVAMPNAKGFIWIDAKSEQRK